MRAAYAEGRSCYRGLKEGRPLEKGKNHGQNLNKEKAAHQPFDRTYARRKSDGLNCGP